MALNSKQREQVRQRAQFVCEYCGLAEIDSGGKLTIDHYQPRIMGGSDDLENLIYCCVHCNQSKHDFWPNSATASHLWNPRREPASLHFLVLDDGMLKSITPTGAFTIKLLRLNRPVLVAYRLRKLQATTQTRWLTQLRELAGIYEQLTAQQADLIAEQRALLEEQRNLLRAISRRLLGD
jgi:HNH endonuclease